MKLNIAVALAAVAVLFTVQAAPAAPEDAVADAEVKADATLFGRRRCCRYAKSGEWCGITGCCLWSDYCVQKGNPALCGYYGCCLKYAC